ncbi:hypothetical protein ED733_002388 [Metarhizium rileyi]|uniref:NADH dehydrogenase (Ubiquinone)-like protein n=1 Tax=Metarhizium rileyi (strain RCEF 4871) TaxID=1649241 RepID=A0A5C6G4Z8_METRR|nr:hypothetical protein ED733_002388 [Metarhizium rileyi]
MRYEDWDILLFPQNCKVPVKEFKVACHVVHDPESLHFGGTFGLPTVCCFVPSLPAGTPFRVSIHSWNVPTVSKFTNSYSKFPENVQFEARLFIDGRLVAEELLQQDYWSPADDLGRIKLVLSEGFPRDSMTTPLERVKNIVAFSFQHAPLGVSIPVAKSDMDATSPNTGDYCVLSATQGNALQAGCPSRKPSTDVLDDEARLSGEKGAKRIRKFTPASARAIDDEEGTHRPSPRVRLTSFLDGPASTDATV